MHYGTGIAIFLLSAPATRVLKGQTLIIDAAAVPFPLDWNHDGSFELILGSDDGRIYQVF